MSSGANTDNPESPENPENPKLLKFFAREYIGTEIHDLIGYPITERQGIKEGMAVLMPTLFGDWVPAVVTQLDLVTGTGRCRSGGIGGHLVFDLDDRHCWVCDCQLNLKGLARVAFAP